MAVIIHLDDHRKGDDDDLPEWQRSILLLTKTLMLYLNDYTNGDGDITARLFASVACHFHIMDEDVLIDCSKKVAAMPNKTKKQRVAICNFIVYCTVSFATKDWPEGDDAA